MNPPTNNKVASFRWHDREGNVILHDEWLSWLQSHDGRGFGPVVMYSWVVAADSYESLVDRKIFNWELLPDCSGFICFESAWKPDNCLLLDAFGKERMRLTVPWKMTGATNPEAEQASTFGSIDGPYANPTSGKNGQFGVSGWVGQGKYYFELDYKTGIFLWCKPIRD